MTMQDHLELAATFSVLACSWHIIESPISELWDGINSNFFGEGVLIKLVPRSSHEEITQSILVIKTKIIVVYFYTSTHFFVAMFSNFHGTLLWLEKVTKFFSLIVLDLGSLGLKVSFLLSLHVN
jgi:hypothetical protein